MYEHLSIVFSPIMLPPNDTRAVIDSSGSAHTFTVFCIQNTKEVFANIPENYSEVCGDDSTMTSGKTAARAPGRPRAASNKSESGLAMVDNHFEDTISDSDDEGGNSELEVGVDLAKEVAR